MTMINPWDEAMTDATRKEPKTPYTDHEEKRCECYVPGIGKPMEAPCNCPTHLGDEKMRAYRERDRRADPGRQVKLRASEHDEQKALFDWLRLNKIPAFSIPNASHLPPRTMGYLKAEGLEPGVPDLFLPSISQKPEDAGIFIEMKSKTGRLTDEQVRWHQILHKKGYAVYICRSADDAIAVVKKYLAWREMK